MRQQWKQTLAWLARVFNDSWYAYGILHHNNKYPINKVVFLPVVWRVKERIKSERELEREKESEKQDSTQKATLQWWYMETWHSKFSHLVRSYSLCFIIDIHVHVDFVLSGFSFLNAIFSLVCMYVFSGFVSYLVFVVDSASVSQEFFIRIVCLYDRQGCLLAFMEFSFVSPPAFHSNLEWCWYTHDFHKIC